MSTLKLLLNINSYSFTFLVLIHAFFAWLGFVPPLSTSHIFLFFLMTTSISILILLTDKLPIQNNVLISLIRILDIVFVVFTLGLLFDLFPLEWIYILYTLGVIVVVYFGVYGVLMIKDHADAIAINKQIRMNLDKSKSKGGQHE